MAENRDYEQLFFGGSAPKKEGAAPTSAPAEAPKATDYENLFFGEDKSKTPAQRQAAAAEEAYEQKIQGLMPKAKEIVEGGKGISGGRTGAFLSGVGDLPFVGPALQAGVRGASAALGQGEGKNFSERYEQLSAEDEAMKRAYKEIYPGYGLAGQVAGAFVLPAGKLAKGAEALAAARGAGATGQAAAKIAGYGAEGAGYGAATAAGEKLFGTAPESQKEGILESAATGAALGAGLSGAGMAGSALLKKIVPEPVKALGRTDEQQWNVLGRAAQRDVAAGDVRLDPQEAIRRMQAGQPVNVSDLYGENFRREYQKILETNPEAARAYQVHMAQRLQDQGTRFEDFVNNTLRGTDRNIADIRQDAVDLGKQMSNQRYASALTPGNGSGSWNPNWDMWLRSPSFRQAVQATEKEIKDEMALRGVSPVNFQSPFRPVMKMNPKTGQWEPKIDPQTGLPELRVAFKNRVDIPYLDALQRNMNGVIQGRFGAEFTPQGGSARQLANNRKTIIDAVTDPQSPFYNRAYAEARSKYAAFSDEKNALDYGQSLLSRVNNSAEAAKIAREARYMSPEERQLATQGLMADILTRARTGAAPGGINTRKLEQYLSTPYIRQAMENILLPQNMQHFEKYVRAEALISKAAQEAQRIRTTPQASQEIRTVLWSLVNAPMAAARYAAVWATTRVNERYAQKLSQKLTSNNPADFKEATDMLTQNPGRFRSFVQFMLENAPRVPTTASVLAAQPNTPTGFADGGLVTDTSPKKKEEHIHQAVEELLEAGAQHPAPPMARGGKSKPVHPASKIPGRHIRSSEMGNPIFEGR
jgi:hypothetical protein